MLYLIINLIQVITNSDYYLKELMIFSQEHSYDLLKGHGFRQENKT